jgi:D-aspartate ligase
MAGYGRGAVLLGSDFKALGTVRSLTHRGIPSVLVDNDPRSAWYSRHPQRRHRWTANMDSPELVKFLLELADDRGYLGWMLFPMQDDAVELISQHTGELEGSFRLATPGWSVLRRVQDKRLVHELADRVGVSRPRTFYPTSAADLVRLNIDYPVIIKPRLSIQMQRTLKRKALVASSEAELVAQYGLAVGSLSADLLMVQELIPGDGRMQFSVATFCQDGVTVIAMAARRTRQFPYDFGMSSSFVEMVHRPDLIEQAARLLCEAGLSGMVEVEFKHDIRDGLDKLLDINVRPWGWHQLCIAAGVDFPYLQYCWAMGDPLPLVVLREGYAWRRMLTDVPAALQEIRAGVTTPADYLHSYMRRRTVRSVWNLSDPLPALADPAVAVMRMAQPRLHAWRDRNRNQAGVDIGLAAPDNGLAASQVQP